MFAGYSDFSASLISSPTSIPPSFPEITSDKSFVWVARDGGGGDNGGPRHAGITSLNIKAPIAGPHSHRPRLGMGMGNL